MNERKKEWNHKLGGKQILKYHTYDRLDGRGGGIFHEKSCMYVHILGKMFIKSKKSKINKSNENCEGRIE